MKMSSRKKHSDEEGDLDLFTLNIEKHLSSSSDVQEGQLLHDLSPDELQGPEKCESLMNCNCVSPSIGKNMYAESCLEPPHPACQLHYTELSDEDKEPPLNGNEQQEAINVTGKDTKQITQLAGRAHDSVDSACPSLEIRQSSFFQAVLNGINILAGVGILSMPYALLQGGWIGLSFLLIFAVICCYTGILLCRCINLDPSITGYPGIGDAAFGKYGRIIVSSLLYLELFVVAAGYLILEGDNFAQLIAWKGIKVKYLNLNAEQSFIVISSIIMLPTVWLRDLRLLSYISAGGVIACVTLLMATASFGVSDTGFTHHSGNLVNLQRFPIAVGLYAFCYCGHAVFPSIYCSMKDKTKFPHVLIVCFILCTLLYGGMAVVGYMMFGENVKSQITLSLPKGKISTQIAIIAALINPFAKYALTLMPVAAALEEFLPRQWNTRNTVICQIFIRSLLVASTVAVATAIPFFAFFIALVGSFLGSTVAIAIPCICYMKLFPQKICACEMGVILLFIAFGLVASIAGTYTSVCQIAKSL